MKRLLLIGLAVCALSSVPTLSALAMPVAKPNAVIAAGTDVIQVRGGHHGHGHMMGHGRGHHRDWMPGRHRGHRH